MVQSREDLMIVMTSNGFPDGGVNFGQTVQHPAVKRWHVFWRNTFFFGEAIKRPQKITKCIAQPAVMINLTLQNFFADPKVIIIVRIRHPNAENISAIFFDHILRRDGIAQ